MNNRIGRDDVVRFVDLARMWNRRLVLVRIQPDSGLDWAAVHRLVGRLEARGFVRTDRFGNRWLEKNIDQRLPEVLRELVDRRGS